MVTLKTKICVFCGDTEDENRRVFVVTLKIKTGVFMW